MEGMGSHGGMGNLGGDGRACSICLINDHREAGSSSVAAAVLDQPRCPSVPTPQLWWSIGRVVAGVTGKEGQMPCD